MNEKRRVFRALGCVVFATAIAGGIAVCGSGEPKRIVVHVDYKAYRSIEEAVRDADMIVVGNVKAVHKPQESNNNLDKSNPPLNRVYTLSDIEIVESVKGAEPGTTITMKQAGGRYKGVSYEESGKKVVEVGKQYLLFLDSDGHAPGDPYTLVYPFQGMVEVKNGVVLSTANMEYVRSGLSVAQVVEKLKSIYAELSPKQTDPK